jgi:hypothetical protein
MHVQAFCAGGVVVCCMWLLTTATAFGGGSLAHIAYSSPLALAYRGSRGTGVRFW